MAEAFNLNQRVRSLEVSPELSGYSGVRIYAGQDDEGNSIEYFAGDETGKVLEITNDWGTQAQADAIYSRILGYRYQPFMALGTHIDPSVELGDAVTISDTYGGVFTRKSTFGRHITSDLEAPFYDEIEHEFQIQSPTNRQYDRFTRQVRSSLSITNSRILAEVEARKDAIDSVVAQLQIQAGLIEAKVSKSGGNPSSFGWVLDDSSWTIRSNSQDILRASKDGLEVYGKVTAVSGDIGGFTIKDNALTYNNQVWEGTNSTGIYIGPNGIQLGKDFSVDNRGNLHAASGTFEGDVYAKNIQYGSTAGYFPGSGISQKSVTGGTYGQIANSTLFTTNMSNGVNLSLGYADTFYNATQGDGVTEFYTSYLYTARLFVNNNRFKPKWLYYLDWDGEPTQTYVLAYSD